LSSDRPRNERRKSSYIDSDRDRDRERSKRESSKRHSTTLPYRDRPREETGKSRRLPTNPEEPVMNGKAGASMPHPPPPPAPKAEPYLAASADKASSWINSLSTDPPLPLSPEETATVVEPPPEVPGGGATATAAAAAGVLSDEEMRGERRRRRRERRDTRYSGEDDGYYADRGRARRSPDQYEPRPEATKRTSWLKKLTGRN